jgi:HAD superfamily hydrolase (TIGR01509 family)
MDVPDEVALFDMDGVLVDSEDYWHAFEDEFVFVDAIESGDPAHEEVTGMHFGEIYDYLDDAYGATLTKEAFVDAYHERSKSLYGEQVALMDGAEALFSDLRDAGRRVGIVSSAPQSWISIVRRRFDLGPLDLVVSAEDIDEAGKPEPHVYEHAAAELGVSPEACVVVEDSINGVESAVRAGAFTVAYRRAHNRELDLSRADRVAEGPGELREILLS